MPGGIREHYTGSGGSVTLRKIETVPFIWGVSRLIWRWTYADNGWLHAVSDHEAWPHVDAPDWETMLRRVVASQNVGYAARALRPYHWHWGTDRPWIGLATSGQVSRRRRERRMSYRAVEQLIEILRSRGAPVAVQKDWQGHPFCRGEIMVLVPADVAVIATLRELCRAPESGQPVPQGLDIPDSKRWRVDNPHMELFPYLDQQQIQTMPNLP
ncbi:MAG: hypothetical protein DYH08_00610 [Actinobacteria bacterium ATB1]|nr:hypothetical protein [Actinobacteria bacterium ATB1]